MKKTKMSNCNENHSANALTSISAGITTSLHQDLGAAHPTDNPSPAAART